MLYSGAVHLSLYKILTVSLPLTFSLVPPTDMPRSRSHSTSSLPGNLMGSWTIHSYSASCAESVVGDPPFEAPYPTIGQSNTSTHAQPIQEMAPPGIEASNTMECMHNPVLPPLRSLTPFAFVDPSITQHVQLPSLAGPQHSFTTPAVPPPSFIGHLTPSQLQRSRSKTPEFNLAFEHVREGCETMFSYWISVARPRKYVPLLFYKLVLQSTTFSFRHHYLTLVQY